MNSIGPRIAFFVPTGAEEFDEAAASFLKRKKIEELKNRR